MARLRQNFQAGSITNNPLLVGDVTLNAAALADLVAVTGSDYLVIVLDPNAVAGDPEIVHVTAHTALATSATITRGQEGSVARQHAVGTAWEHNITEDDFDYANLANLPSGGGGLRSITVIATGTTTYNTPAGITSILVEAVAGGGGGGGSATAAVSASAAAGGGGGGLARVLIDNPDASYACVVGAGGAGGAAGANNGSAGTDSTFDSPSVCTATAGSGGGSQAAGTAAAIAQGATNGVGTVGDSLAAGSGGGNGIRLSGTVASSGFGGASPSGGGGRGRASEGDGLAGGIPGGGGGGALTLNGGTIRAGGAGANGEIVVYEFGV